VLLGPQHMLLGAVIGVVGAPTSVVRGPMNSFGMKLGRYVLYRYSFYLCFTFVCFSYIYF
jgi:hypothetical protein